MNANGQQQQQQQQQEASAAGATPLRLLLSQQALEDHAEDIAAALQGRPHQLVTEGDAEIGFVSRDVTGLSTNQHNLPDTQAYYDRLLAAPSMRWVHTHSAGVDRPVFQALMARGVQLSTSSGANAEVVAQTAVAGLLALARRFPQLMAAQQRREWAPLIAGPLPRDLQGQRATIVGWGPIGQHLARMLPMFGLQVAVVRSSASPAAPGVPTVAFEQIGELLPATDWLLLACPLSERTRGLVDADALARLPVHAHVLNVARGAVIDEPALVEALRRGRIAGAFLDVFAEEPLATDSPLWHMPQVMAQPHSAGFSDGNARRVAGMFLDNLGRFARGEPLLRLAA